MKNIARFLVILLVLTSLVTGVLAQTRRNNGDNVGRMNRKTGQTLSANGVDALYNTARVEPGLKMVIIAAAGTQDYEGNLELKGFKVVPKGQPIPGGNSGIAVTGVPVTFPATAQFDRKLYTVFCVKTGISFEVLDECLNVKGRRPGVPHVNRQLIETTTKVDFDLNLEFEFNIDFQPVVTATATASTSPIYNIINITTPGAPLMMGGGSSPNQYYVVRDQRGFLSLGTTIGNGTKICITNNNVNINDNNNVNNNNNSNSNSNSNSNNINIGGEPAPEPLDELLACSEIDGYVDSLFQLDGHRPRESIAA